MTMYTVSAIILAALGVFFAIPVVKGQIAVRAARRAQGGYYSPGDALGGFFLAGLSAGMFLMSLGVFLYPHVVAWLR